ncbi:unnamed protein product [Gongylonema pulchrum]|uniref:Vegetative cell wall protein gp1-like n=1 Tax=Gongylonema pulchrum TaxID=637853 RepID=A0A183DQ60_9BILA|nr:unnamed protein product [Gongylonema pulchrum]
MTIAEWPIKHGRTPFFPLRPMHHRPVSRDSDETASESLEDEGEDWIPFGRRDDLEKSRLPMYRPPRPPPPPPPFYYPPRTPPPPPPPPPYLPPSPYYFPPRPSPFMPPPLQEPPRRPPPRRVLDDQDTGLAPPTFGSGSSCCGPKTTPVSSALPPLAPITPLSSVAPIAPLSLAPAQPAPLTVPLFSAAAPPPAQPLFGTAPLQPAPMTVPLFSAAPPPVQPLFGTAPMLAPSVQQPAFGAPVFSAAAPTATNFEETVERGTLQVFLLFNMGRQ